MAAGATPTTAAPPPGDPRLERAIGTTSIRHQAVELVRLALQALVDLRSLDDGLYDQFVATRTAPTTVAATAASLERLWHETFGGLLELLAHCRRLDAARPEPAPAAPAGREAATDDLDFGEERGALARPSDDLELGASDIGTLLDGIGGLDEASGASDEERWARVVEQVGAIAYGLRSQQDDAARRIAVALAAGKVRQVLGLLDDTQSAASEGVHALVTAVYAAFVPDADPAGLAPGYLTALDRALLVRRGIAELAAGLAPLNATLQGPDAARHGPALDEARQVLKQFVDAAVCHAMRAADRWQMVQFEQQLVAEPLAAARQTCEGLTKYLESLASINQREVLIVHDQRQLDEMRELLANARQLFDLSPPTADDMLHKAHQTARALRGRNPIFDRQLTQLEARAPDEAPPSDRRGWLEQLEDLLAAAGD